jgi:hypothetical protein
VVGLEESADSHDGERKPALGCAAESWRTAETWDRRLVRPRSQIQWFAGASPPSQTRQHSCRITSARSWRPISSSSRPRPTGLLFVLVLLADDRRRIRHVAVTAHPTAAWTAQQLREAFPWDEAPRYLIHDRDHAFDGLSTTRSFPSSSAAPRSELQPAFRDQPARAMVRASSSVGPKLTSPASAGTMI